MFQSFQFPRGSEQQFPLHNSNQIVSTILIKKKKESKIIDWQSTTDLSIP